MKTTPRYLQTLLALSACSTASAQVTQAVTDAINDLRETANYTWKVTTELSGAPFKVPAITGTTDKTGLSHLTSNGGKRQAVLLADARVLKTKSGWKDAGTLDELDNPGNGELLVAKAPPDALLAIVATLSELNLSAPGEYKAVGR